MIFTTQELLSYPLDFHVAHLSQDGDTSSYDNLYYKGRCLCVCGHSNVQMLTSPPVLKLWDTQGYLWLSYDLTEVIKLFGVTFKQKNIFFFKKILYVIPSPLVSFLPCYCHSFRITVIPSGLLSFLPYQCHSFGILSFLPNHYHFKIFVILNSSGTLPYPKGEKNGHRRWPYMRVLLIILDRRL